MGSSNTKPTKPTKYTISTQKNFNPFDYQGKWYEIARYPTLVWEQDCETAEANYVWDAENSQLLVENVCLDQYQKFKRSRTGRAKLVDPMDKSKLMLKFTDGLPAGPESPYWVIRTDYVNYSIVSEPTKKFLWVLTREPDLYSEDIPYVKDAVRRLGFDPNKLVFSKSRIR